MTPPGDRRPSEWIRLFLDYSRFRYWTASLLPAFLGTTLPFWLHPPGFSFRLSAAVEFLMATLLFHAGFSFLLAMSDGMLIPVWRKSRLWMVANICIAAACLLGVHLNFGLTLHAGVPQGIFIIYGLVTLFVGVLYVVPPINLHRRVGAEIAVAEGLGMIPVLGAYLVQVGDLTRTVYLASLPLIVATGLWVWMEELAGISDDEKSGRRTLVMDLGLKFSGRFGVLALAAAFFGTLIVAVISTSTPPVALTALLFLPLVCRIVSVSWNGYSHPESMVTPGRDAVLLHLITGLILAVSPFVTLL